MFSRAYDCARDCSGAQGRRRRQGRGCTRRDLPPVPWDVSAAELYQRPTINHSDGDDSGVHWHGHAIYFGRQADKRLDGARELGIAVDWEQPIEPAADGCPAGWAYSPFATSVADITRRRTRDGGRVPSPAFDRATWQAQEAAEYLEEQQDRWHGYVEQVNGDRWRAENDRKRREAERGRR